ncbi:T-cell surface glycoprotein CD3 zeta chain-like [Mastacembelus armatus]|uniref:T-cell surface glycoprotein CD3 zeta chain-like n=1 Tax=Mastacembelus armatus TaxID=205130 RepID=A0A7N8XZY9_9TELE|nr:T-cell surface glycoprotein CD3 zeta chain-like [Mastacembelus armatus]
MDKLRTGVFVVLFVLVLPASCEESFFTDPVICYFLDGILVVYSISVTALYFREKFSSSPPAVSNNEEDKGGIYQELERPKDADPYQELKPTKKKKKAAKKNKSKAAQPEDNNECLNLSRLPPSPSPH